MSSDKPHPNTNTNSSNNAFGDNPYQAEAQQLWGQTDAFKQSQQRTANYSATDWDRYKTESADLYARFANLMQSGACSSSDQALALAEEHRLLITSWFYDCCPQMHANLAQMWVSDPRFKANIDKSGEGLTEFMATAVQAVNSSAD